MQREIPFRKIKQARTPVSKGTLSASAHGFLLAVCQSKDRYKEGFLPIKIKQTCLECEKKQYTNADEVQNKGVPESRYGRIAG